MIKENAEFILMNAKMGNHGYIRHWQSYTGLNIQFISVICFEYGISRKSWFKQKSSLPGNLKFLFDQTDPEVLKGTCRTFLFQDQITNNIWQLAYFLIINIKTNQYTLTINTRPVNFMAATQWKVFWFYLLFHINYSSIQAE